MPIASSGRPGSPRFRPGLLRPGALDGIGGVPYTRTVTESLVTSESMAGSRGQDRTVFESLTTSDAASHPTVRVINETISSAFDVPSFGFSFTRAIQETTLEADVPTRVVSTSRALNEAVSSSDVVGTPKVNGSVGWVSHETLFTADIVTRNLDYGRVANEALTTADSAVLGMVNSRAVSESLTTLDSVVRLGTLDRFVSELIPFGGVAGLGDVFFSYQAQPSLPLSDVKPYYARAWTHGWPNPGAYIRTLGRMLNRPAIKSTINAGYHPIQLDFGAAGDVVGVSAGDVVELVEQGTGRIVYTGIVSDDPQDIGTGTTYSLTLDPLQTELGDVPFSNLGTNYLTDTRVSDVVRLAVEQTQHLHWAPQTIPDSPEFLKFNFDSGHTALAVIEQCQKIAGPQYWFFVDERGFVWFQRLQGADASNNYKIQGASNFLIKLGTDISMKTRKAPISALKNYVNVLGGIPTSAAGTALQQISALSDQSYGSPYGKKALLPPLTYSNNFDAPTLQAIANTVCTVLNRRITQITLTLPNYGKRFDMAQPGGCTVSFYEPGRDILNDSYVGFGGTLGPYMVVDTEVDGTVQKVTLSDLPITLDEIQYQLDQVAARTAIAATTAATQATTPVAGGGLGSVGGGGINSCGGFVLLSRGITNGTVLVSTGYDVITQQGFILDSGGNCQIFATASGSIKAPAGSDIVIKLYVDRDGSGEVYSVDQRITADGTHRPYSVTAPSMSALPDGTYNAYVIVKNANGSVDATGDVQVYLVSSGGTSDPLVGLPGDGTAVGGTGGIPFATGSMVGQASFNYKQGFDQASRLRLSPDITGSQIQFPTTNKDATAVVVTVSLSAIATALSHNTNALFSVYLRALHSAGTGRLPQPGDYVSVQPVPAFSIAVGVGTQSGNFSASLPIPPSPTGASWEIGVLVEAQDSTAADYIYDQTGSGRTASSSHAPAIDVSGSISAQMA